MNWFWRFLGYDALSDLARKHFDRYQSWFIKLTPCDETLDVTLTVRIRAFGREADKQSVWDQDWRTKYPDWGPAAAGVTVSSKVPEVWCDMRITKAGLVINPAVLGHEMLHVLKLKDKQVCNPDLLVDEDIY